MRYIFLLIMFGITACSAGPDYQQPNEAIADQWTSGGDHISMDLVQRQWWRSFGDPLLDRYIERAVQNNKDVEIALANVRRARALRGVEGASLLPQIGSDAQASRTKSSEASSSFNSGQIRNSYDAGFDASWELDIFGGNRRAIEAADARVGSAIEDYHAAMLSTLSEVARNYYEARGLQKRITITKDNAELLQQTTDLINARLDAGEANEFDLSRAQGEYELTRARLPNLEADLNASIYTLSILLGEPPEFLLDEMRRIQPLPPPPDIVPVGLRSEILRRRPDVRMAERDLAAEVADIGVETSELFPKFFLTGDLGSQARVFGDLFTAAGGVWSLASMVQWSVFEGGAIRARIDVQEAESQAALAQYEKTVLEALRDTETALTSYGQELETRKRIAQGVESRRKSVRLARELFDAGEEDYLAVLDAERELISSEDNLVVSETNSITKLIALYTALGGGWQRGE